MPCIMARELTEELAHALGVLHLVVSRLHARKGKRRGGWVGRGGLLGLVGGSEEVDVTRSFQRVEGSIGG